MLRREAGVADVQSQEVGRGQSKELCFYPKGDGVHVTYFRKGRSIFAVIQRRNDDSNFVRWKRCEV